jgi:uncharacterized protein YjiS (DUF1127 family)
MTMTSSNRKGLSLMPDFLYGMTNRVTGYVSRNRAERQLEALDDRLLADIGMTRTDIQKMVWGR